MCIGRRHRGKERDNYSKKRQAHAVKRVQQRTIMSFDELRRAVTSGVSRVVGVARYGRQLHEVVQPNNVCVYVVWDQNTGT